MAATSRSVPSISFWQGLLAGLLVVVPFHALLTVWLASNFGHYTVWRLWIEAVLGLLLVGCLITIRRQKLSLASKTARQLWWLSVMYVALQFLLGAVALIRHNVNLAALGDGLILNLRLMVAFWLAVVTVHGNAWLKRHWLVVVLGPAMIVVAFGLAQHFLLPVDFLRHLGYGPHTILPFETVDQKLAYVRVMSTLRGANPLGAYLVVVVASLSAALIQVKKAKPRGLLLLMLLATLIVLFYTYSRSAWLGAVLALASLIWLTLRDQKLRRLLALAVVVFGVIGLVATLALKHNNGFENTFFHTDTTSRSATSSNQNHVSALQAGLRDIARDPFGLGPGTAGPASTHNKYPTRIAENYYVQLGQEVGVLGAGLFIAINVLIGQLLWKRRREPLALALLASLLGLSFINVVSHAWTDDSLAVLWWALAGIALTSDIIKLQHETQTAKTKSFL